VAAEGHSASLPVEWHTAAGGLCWWSGLEGGHQHGASNCFQRKLPPGANAPPAKPPSKELAQKPRQESKFSSG